MSSGAIAIDGWASTRRRPPSPLSNPDPETSPQGRIADIHSVHSVFPCLWMRRGRLESRPRALTPWCRDEFLQDVFALFPAVWSPARQT